MSLFLKLDPNWPDHEKIVLAGLEAAGLHAVAMCLSKRQEVDGWLSRTVLIRRYGATDDLIDRMVELVLFDAEGTNVRPHGWLRRNLSQAAIGAIRSEKSDAAKAGNHARWKHPGPVADCVTCHPDRSDSPKDAQVVAGCDSDVVRVRSDRTPIRSLEPEVEVDLEPDPNPEPEPPPDSHPTPADIGEAIAAWADLLTAQRRPDSDPRTYAAGIRSKITNQERERLVKLLADGATPPAAAAIAAAPPEVVGSSRTPVDPSGRDAANAKIRATADRREAQRDTTPGDAHEHADAIRRSRRPDPPFGHPHTQTGSETPLGPFSSDSRDTGTTARGAL